MDPNTTLQRIRTLMAQLRDTDDSDNLDADRLLDRATELTEAVESLDNWLTKGGFMPAEWLAGRSSR